MSTGTNRERIEQNNTLLEDIKTQIQNLPEAGGSGDIKQFATQEEMQADTTAQEGDLAVVYRNEVQNATVDSKFQVATFPETVVLDNAMTDYVNVRYRAVDSSKMFACWGSLNSSNFMMDCNTESGSIRIQYTSSDGITYTRTDITGNPVDFGTEIHYERPERWNDAIGKFIQVGGSTFEGLYAYSALKDGDYILLHTTTGRTLKMPNVTLFGNASVQMNRDIVVIVVGETDENNRILSGTAYTDYPFNEYNVAVNNGNLTTSRDVSGGFGYGYVFTCDYQNNKILVPDGNFEGGLLPYNAETEYATNCNIYSDTTYTSTLFESTYQYEYKYTYAPTQLTAIADYVYGEEFYGKNGVETGTLTQDISNSFTDMNAEVYGKIQNYYDNLEPRVLTDSDKTINKNIYCIPAKSDGTPLLDTSSVTNMIHMFEGCDNLTTIPLLNTSSVTNMSYMFNGCDNLTTISQLDTSNVTDMSDMFRSCTNLIDIPLLDTSSVTNISYMFYDCTNLTTIPLLDTSKVTVIVCMFYDCTNLTTIPLLNTSNVTNMNSMFYNCTNLTEIPLLNTSNVTNMSYMFAGCTSLTTIPQLNIGNATDMRSMFEGCDNLTTMPLLDTSSVTNISYMFHSCTNLTTIPQLNTSSVTNMIGMFQACTNLATIPQLNTSKVTDMRGMFAGCTSLTDESLNNILAMCKNAIKVTSSSYKTLESIGLTSAQATKCTTLSNYSAFTAAGWTTGY